MSDGRGSGVIPPAKGAIQVKCPGSGWLSRHRPPVLSWWSCRHSGPEFTSVVTLHGEANRRDLSNPDDRFFLRIEVAHACRSSDDTSRRLRSALAFGACGSSAGWGARCGTAAVWLHAPPYPYTPAAATCRRTIRLWDGRSGDHVVAPSSAQQRSRRRLPPLVPRLRPQARSSA